MDIFEEEPQDPVIFRTFPKIEGILFLMAAASLQPSKKEHTHQISG
jgi:hypothetical protein